MDDFTDSLIDLEADYRPEMTVDEIIKAYQSRIDALKTPDEGDGDDDFDDDGSD